MSEALLHDRRVLVVEDEYMIAEAVSRNLRKAGATVIGPASDVEGALALLLEHDDVDSAVLDINLGEAKVYPVVDVLLARGARCVFATGNDRADVPPAYALLKRCEKPIDTSCIVKALLDGDGCGTRAAGTDDPSAMTNLRECLAYLITVAEEHGETLLVAKLCEAADVAAEI